MSTYSQLQSDVAAWIDRSDLTVQIQSFIVLAEQEANRQLRVLQQEKANSQSLNISGKNYTLPDRFIAMRNIYIDVVFNGRPRKLSYVTPEILILAQPSTDGYPTMYTIENNEIVTDSVSLDATKNLIIGYFEGFEALSNTNTTNWLTQNAYAVLLYGAIIEAEIYLYNEVRTQILQSRMDSIIDRLNKTAEEGRYSGDPIRVRAT